MLSSAILLLILLVYLLFLFGVAHWAEKKRNSKWVNNPYIYSLSLAVYCSAWTYYGSIGVAAESGLSYLTIYLGPVIIIPAWIILLKKVIRISRVNNISSIADFISLRYGNSRFLGAFVTILIVLGILPYISLQLKAIAETFHLITNTQTNANFLLDTTTYVAIALAIFASFYGTRYVDASEKRKGIVTAIALESVIKLFFFILVGIYVTFFVFDGFDAIYAQASQLPDFEKKNTIGGLAEAINWFFLCMLSIFAIFLLPRQFHLSVVENNRENHLQTAVWLFPLYLLLFNFFVYPIAWGGNILFENQTVNPDTYSLLIPMLFNQKTITVLVFLGGFSAAISMIVVATISLSIMVSNNLLIPYGFIRSFNSKAEVLNSKSIVNIRKISIFILIIFAFIVYRLIAFDYSLVSIGLVSFVIIAQLAPSFFGALFWKRGSLKGTIAGLTIGFSIVAYTLLIPYILGSANADNVWIQEGLFSNQLLKPFALFGLDFLDPIPHALFWSLTFNLFFYAAISVSFKGNYRERNYAEMYVEISQYITNHEDAFVWKGTAYIEDIKKVLERFLGVEKTKRAMTIFNVKYKIPADTTMADARFIKFAENLLTGHIGTASAKILIAGVTKEEKISLPEVLKILEESKENLLINKKLVESSNELKKISAQLQIANQRLIEKDLQKDEFLDTVTHELRTPITAIRASSEILFEDEDIPVEIRQQFLNTIISESDRLNRLIDKILDLEKYESGKQIIHIEKHNIFETIENSLAPLHQLISNQKIFLDFKKERKPLFWDYDEEKIIQVITNLVSNAIKFCNENAGYIQIQAKSQPKFLQVDVFNNGKNIPNNDVEAIFDKFYQSSNQNIKKPIGSGLGLAICKQIAEAHGGEISVENLADGVVFSFSIPKIDVSIDEN